MRFGAIIPTVDDETALHRLLARLADMCPPPDEIVVVDGAASAACALACRAAGASWIPTRTGRAGSLALGAAHCRADVPQQDCPARGIRDPRRVMSFGEAPG